MIDPRLCLGIVPGAVVTGYWFVFCPAIDRVGWDNLRVFSLDAIRPSQDTHFMKIT